MKPETYTASFETTVDGEKLNLKATGNKKAIETFFNYYNKVKEEYSSEKFLNKEQNK